jgi:hypothetical protein
MKLVNKFTIDYRSATAIHLPEKGINGIEMILPGASTCTVASSSCSCGAIKKRCG